MKRLVIWWEKIFVNMLSTKDQKYLNNCCESIRKRQRNRKLGKRHEQANIRKANSQ